MTTQRYIIHKDDIIEKEEKIKIENLIGELNKMELTPVKIREKLEKQNLTRREFLYFLISVYGSINEEFINEWMFHPLDRDVEGELNRWIKVEIEESAQDNWKAKWDSARAEGNPSLSYEDFLEKEKIIQRQKLEEEGIKRIVISRFIELYFMSDEEERALEIKTLEEDKVTRLRWKRREKEDEERIARLYAPLAEVKKAMETLKKEKEQQKKQQQPSSYQLSASLASLSLGGESSPATDIPAAFSSSSSNSSFSDLKQQPIQPGKGVALSPVRERSRSPSFPKLLFSPLSSATVPDSQSQAALEQHHRSRVPGRPGGGGDGK